MCVFFVTFDTSSCELPPNGLAHLPPGLAGRQNHDSLKIGETRDPYLRRRLSGGAGIGRY